MILADTSIWIDHLRVTNIEVSRAIADRQLLMHPFVLGELALGSLRNRGAMIAKFRKLRMAPIARLDSVLDMIERAPLFNCGIGYVDAHLLASCLLAGNTKLLARDRRLRQMAEQLGVAA